MEYSVGQRLCIEGEAYDIVGKIEYRNRADGTSWMEYRLLNRATHHIKWLSYDDGYREFSISEVVNRASTDGYHEVDRGTEVVVNAWGQVDVERGDSAEFIEYEDITEEKIISVERWDDGKEMSKGHYVELNDIILVNNGNNNNFNALNFQQRNVNNNKNKLGSIIPTIIIIASVLLGLIGAFVGGRTTIAKYLEKKSSYEYVTSITGNDKQKADVYRSSYDLDTTVKDIIDAIDGNTVDVQQNTEDDDTSVAILTTKEYCLVYISEEDEVLVQISSREYAYGTDTDPYHSRWGTCRYYRRYYYSRGYSSDKSRYKGNETPYSTYDDTTLDKNYADSYDTYSRSVRQASARSRSSSGGGTSSGK